MIKTKIELQKVIMLNNPVYWDVEELTNAMRVELRKRGMGSISQGTVSRNIRYFKEPKHGLRVEKVEVSKDFWKYRVTPINPIKQCSASEYAARK